MKILIMFFLSVSIVVSAHDITKYNIDQNLLSMIQKHSDRFEVNYKDDKINMLFVDFKIDGKTFKEKSEIFINKYGNLFGIDNFKRLEIARVISLKRRTIIHFKHIESNIEVINSEFILVFSKKTENLIQVTNSFDNVKIKSLPTFFSKIDIIDIINAKYQLSYNYEVSKNVKLMIYPTKNEYRYIYRAYLPLAPHLNYYYDIDAETGKFIGRYNHIWHAVNAKVYQPSPIITENPVDVELINLGDNFLVDGTDEFHKLYGKNVKSHNCLKAEKIDITYQGINGYVCGPNIDAVATVDGENLKFDYTPELNPLTQVDTFATVQMYYHVDKAHNYFWDTFYEEGTTPLMPSLYSLVNFQYGAFGQWMSFDNAFFSPQEQNAQLQEFGYNINEDAIVFGQGSKDFSYDADVIYHEYTHGVVDKTSKLNHNNFDKYGLSVEPGAMNEAYADYFSSTMTGDSVVGNYIEIGRDLNNTKKCPEDIVGEVHYDSVFYSGALWDIREALGSELADDIIFNAMASLASDSGMNDGRLATEAAAFDIDPAHKDIVAEKFLNHGLVECDRVIPYVGPINMLFVPGINNTENASRTTEYAPVFAQHKVTLEDGKVGIKIKFSSKGESGILGEGEAPKLSVLFKKGSPILYSYENGFSVNDADMLVDVKIDNGEAILQGPCVEPGEWYFQFINYGKSGSFRNINLSFIEFELVGPKYDNCDTNLCKDVENGYCEGDTTCINSECIDNCSADKTDGYCVDGFKCMGGECIELCSENKLDGYCDDQKTCLAGSCQFYCNQPGGTYCDIGTCRKGICLEDCSAKVTNGYCEGSAACVDGKCKENKPVHKGSGICSYGSNEKNSLLLFFMLILFTIIIRRRKLDKC